ncbi:hypothetical protein [Planococcus versutus]|uniref:Uncharacterized protein n=1 Tax=Planococcus versutus TaxID=1302659 RepID=A0A1B1RZ95_9BACL|nr:hypothetical protein [Planococcus versutus]ANU26263.1 hypothetical protein I858_004355 [Planococcus versutus]
MKNVFLIENRTKAVYVRHETTVYVRLVRFFVWQLSKKEGVSIESKKVEVVKAIQQVDNFIKGGNEHEEKL